ncbi:AIPR family protein [Pseudobutyrivibrio ruminis]|uniref:AIPR protein n=1 Tax=Pseudobutyrivibrio ruminis DSM 9787 TaxID=1123011 RepID=A0A285REK3_9FIRM|nr:AIPR family protein [Pseudobutyrivibrio ruminis]SOB92555.1 AIPR protein [Pseudobutyrivibrio ruminis DSM 9787]
MQDFRKQIEEDIAEYAEKYSSISNISKPEWAFNFWVLDKLFSEDEQLIEEKIVDYDDKGIDCYVWHEDMKDLYLIQNKFYSEGTNLSVDYVMNDFLTRAIGALEKGTYTRSKELQDIYNKFHQEEDFHIYFYLYVTNNSSKTKSIMENIAKFNQQNAHNRMEAKFFSLDDIQQTYFDEPLVNKKSFNYTINTINKGTILNVNNDAYKMTQALDAKYVLTPVLTIYKMVQAAKKENYPLFDDNIREYLGGTGGVNKKIKDTLNNPNDRINFFFYNNGITMIVDDIGSEQMGVQGREFEVFDPQIVNGCQTVSTIYDALSSLPPSSLDKEFENTYVMVKILKIPANDGTLKELYQNIVRYNNSQNAITEKTFTAIANVFKRVQAEFEAKGFLVCIKQSDKYTFTTKYKTPTALIDANKLFINRFGLDELTKVKDFVIDLEKLLQVFVAFESTPLAAIQNKSKLLKQNDNMNKQVVEFIKNPLVTSNDLLNLYLLYLRAEKEKKTSQDGKSPNPFYLIYCFSKYECLGDPSKISVKLSSKEEIDKIVKKYKLTLIRYYKKWVSMNPGKEYNDMIKSQVDISILDEEKDGAEDLLALGDM